MENAPLSAREVSQVFVSDVAFTRDEDGFGASGKVEISLRARDGSASGPTLEVGAYVQASPDSTLREITEALIKRAIELVGRIAREPTENLIAMEALPFDEKFKRADDEQ